jgi:hypothetical protein
LSYFVRRQSRLIARSGGPGGSAVANRLTENPDFSVLVLEAGGAYVLEARIFLEELMKPLQ